MDALKNKLLFVLFLSGLLNVRAQDSLSLSLEKCLDLAFQYNVAYHSALLQSENSKARLHSAGASLLPSVSGFANQGISTGKSINPYTNTFINQEVTTGQYGLSASMALFNGFSNLSNLQQNVYSRKAAGYDLEQARLDLQIQVTLNYVQALSAEELLRQAQVQLEATNEQLKRMEQLQLNGAISPSVLHDTRGQLANDKIAVITARSMVVNSRMALSELINQELPGSTKLEKIRTEVSAEKNGPEAEQLFNAAKDRSPLVQSGNYKARAAHTSVRASWGSAFPTLALVGNLGSNYSSAAARQTVSRVYDAPGSAYVMVNGNSTPVYDQQVEYSSQKINFNNQIRNNLFTYVGLSLQVPILNGLRNKQQINLSQNNYEFSKVQQKGNTTRFRSQVTTACNELTNSKEKYLILEEQVNEFRQSYEIAKSRFEKGAISSFEFISAKTNYEKAAANSITARYDYIYRKKVIDLYLAL